MQDHPAVEKRATFTLLITGFGAFPGAPQNPSARVAARLMRVRRPALDGVRRAGHVFATTYAAVDADLPALLSHEKPDAILMFGVATRAKRIRIETLARNRRLLLFPDAAGFRPLHAAIAPGGPSHWRVPAKAMPLVAAARAIDARARARVDLSRNAGAYLCNYALWRGLEVHPAVIFVHVPQIFTKAQPAGRSARQAVANPQPKSPPSAGRPHPPSRRLTFGDMSRVAEAVMLAYVAQLKRGRSLAR